jgi:hypothetical protein
MGNQPPTYFYADFIGEDVTVVYTEGYETIQNENGENQSVPQLLVVKGRFVAEDPHFIYVKADVNNLLFNKKDVVKVKARREGDEV